MRRELLTAVLAGGLLLGASDAFAARGGVVFVHGTGDQTNALANYWSSSAVASMAAGRIYLAVSYPGSSCDATQTCSWGSITDQIGNWASANGVTDIVVVTHSNGNNPVRYMLAHTGAWTGSRYVSAVTNTFRKVIFIAGDHTGTPLADKVTTSGSVASIANAIASAFGFGNWNVPAVWQQRQDRMSTYNSNGTFAGSAGASTINGIPAVDVQGTAVYANIFSGDAWCGGYQYTLGLKATALYGWGSFGACTDGMIGCNSSGYTGTVVDSDGRLNHQQSRQGCHGESNVVSGQVSNILRDDAPPPDFTISPGAQACNATVQGWGSDMYGDSVYWDGCPSSYQSDGSFHSDCYVSYGYSDGLNATYTDGYTNGSGTPVTDHYSSTFYNTLGCSDSWLGDGQCDMCLVAKYGFDSAPGQTNEDDCYNGGSGTTNVCSDYGYNNSTGWTGYWVYQVSH